MFPNVIILDNLSTMKILLTLFVLFFSSQTLSEELASWGFTGDSCNQFFKILELENGEEFAQVAIRSFLTGFNTSLAFQNKFNELRILNHNTSEYALSYIKNNCKKGDMNETQVWIVLYDYFNNLPLAE